MFKKAQAAMEFLMTYGWAILVVLVVIGALAYFGVLSPSTLLPEKCTFPVSVNCVDHSVSGSAVTLIMLNGAGRDMAIRGVTATSDALGATASTPQATTCSTESDLNGIPTVADACPVTQCSGGSTFRNGQRTTITIDQLHCVARDTGRDKNKYNITVYYSWLDSPTLMHTLPRELLSRKS